MPVLGGVRIATARSQLRDFLNTDVKGFEASLTTPSGIRLRRFITRSCAQRSFGSIEVWNLTPSFPSRDRSSLTAALNPSAFSGTTIDFSPFSWAFRPSGQDARNQARKEWVSLKPEINIGVLLALSPAGSQVLVTWAFEVVHLACRSEARACR